MNLLINLVILWIGLTLSQIFVIRNTNNDFAKKGLVLGIVTVIQFVYRIGLRFMKTKNNEKLDFGHLLEESMNRGLLVLIAYVFLNDLNGKDILINNLPNLEYSIDKVWVESGLVVLPLIGYGLINCLLVAN